MIVRDIMTAEIRSVTADMTLPQIAKLLLEDDISGMPVVDSTGYPVGIVTESDLIAPGGDGKRSIGRERWLTQMAEGQTLAPQTLAPQTLAPQTLAPQTLAPQTLAPQSPALLDRPALTAGDVMTSPVVTVSDTAGLAELARLFIEYRIKCLPVLRAGAMVGIVSRVDLVRQMTREPVQPSSAAEHGGLFSQAIAKLDERFLHARPSTASEAKPAEPPDTTVTAEGFNERVGAFDQRKVDQQATDLQQATERRKTMIAELLERHIEDATWRALVARAQTAAEAGQTEMLLLRFPCELCSDGGRAINAPLPEWPGTLRGEAAEIYLNWERDLKPNGFHLIAQVLDFPGGMPGDIGLTLVWGG